jgi:hypothetical protein
MTTTAAAGRIRGRFFLLWRLNRKGATAGLPATFEPRLDILPAAQLRLIHGDGPEPALPEMPGAPPPWGPATIGAAR